MKAISALLALGLLCGLCALVRGETAPEIRARLGIPDEAKWVMVFGQTAHLDWDWLNFFSTQVRNIPRDIIPPASPFFNNNTAMTPQPTDTIFATAADYLAASERYGYFTTETGFLREFAKDNPAKWAQLKSFNPTTFSIIGGGVTSPDNLIPHGEAIIRNFLTGMRWLKSQNVTWTNSIFMPDDFGSDSQLPILLEAMGATSLGISRVQGGCNQPNEFPPPGFKSAAKILLDPEVGGLNFNWQADDGSGIFTYYMPQEYCCGDRLHRENYPWPNSPIEAAYCNRTVNASTPFERIQTWVNVRQPLSQTRYMYLATGCDFAMPVSDLLDVIDSWNKEAYPSNGVWLVASQFDKYVDLVQEALVKTRQGLHTRYWDGQTYETRFRPTPFFNGFYVTRPNLKQMHYDTVKALQTSEALLVIAKAWNIMTPSISQDRIEAIWNDFAPSTHHDFVTGTSTDYVYYGEQIPILTKALGAATKLRSKLFQLVASKFSSPASKTSALVVMNQNGFASKGPVIVGPSVSLSPKSDFDSFATFAKSSSNTQLTAEGEVIGIFDAPSFGLKVHSPSNTSIAQGKVTLTQRETDITLTNSLLQVTFSQTSNWEITQLVDLAAGKNVLAKGNTFQWRNDLGNIYRFGYEEGCGFDLHQWTLKTVPAVILESGPIRARVLVSFAIFPAGTSQFNPTNYSMEYSLIAGEPFVRISLTGAAAGTSSVITAFDFGSVVSSYDHGTPYHWTTKEPLAWGVQDDFKITFEPTHNFIIPRDASGNALAAIYHSHSPAWGSIGATLYGALLRNAPGGQPRTDHCHWYGADGSDRDVHTVKYAIRIPSGLGIPSTGQPLMESKTYNNPLMGTLLTVDPSTIGSIYSPVSSADASVHISALKVGTYDDKTTIFRLYSPSNNKDLKANVVFGEGVASRRTTIAQVTALEDSLPPSFVHAPLSFSTTNATTVMLRALQSYQLK